MVFDSSSVSDEADEVRLTGPVVVAVAFAVVPTMKVYKYGDIHSKLSIDRIDHIQA